MTSATQLSWALVVLFLLQPFLVFSQPLVERAKVIDSVSQLKKQYDYVIVGEAPPV